MSNAFVTLLWMAATLLVFAGFDRVSKRFGRPPLLHPVLWSVPVLMAALWATRTPYAVYADATRFITFLLGPAVVCMAVPIWAQRATIRRLALPVGLALMAGSLTAIVSAVGIVWAFGAPEAVLASMAPRAATSPVGMAVAETLGGIPALAAVIIVFSGVLGAMIATPLLNLMRMKDYRVRGFAVGVSAHGVGSARAFQVSKVAGAYAGLGMALNAVMTTVLLSIFAALI
ncbi:MULTISPECIES: LrgB family protein [unclassified Brevundimonas]|uniref:LrgB family protein n=1 Tax=unclassified Brevundimonas TaxID=2622653 RepID=UPI0025BCDE80|nr:MULTISPECIES: LrgB family protein [unclassified Brevundimonas]